MEILLNIDSMENREGFIWFDGELIEWNKAQLHLLSHGLHYASSVFEGERSYSGKIFKLKEHTERLFDSAKQLDLRVPFSIQEINDACYQTLEKNDLSDAYVRPIIWRGAETMGVSAPNSKIHCAIAVWEWPSYFSQENKLKGIRLTLSDWKRPSPETIPCQAKAAGLYMICTLSKQEAETKGYDDALMLDWRGQVAEATGANIFFMKEKEIHTPLPDCFLNGITRRTVIDIAKEKDFEVIERKIELEELDNFEQCFITGTAAEVTPVSVIDDYSFFVGNEIKELSDAYIDLVNNWNGE
jgi:branched-chain amino acid aminotransferase